MKIKIWPKIGLIFALWAELKSEELKLKLGWLNKTSPPGDTFIHTSYSDLQNFRTFHRNPENCSKIA